MATSEIVSDKSVILSESYDRLKVFNLAESNNL
jgi:hypothetical protein